MNKSLLTILILFSAQSFASATFTASEDILVPANSSSLQILNSDKEATAADLADEKNPSHTASAICNLTYVAKPDARIIQKGYELNSSADFVTGQTLDDANDYFLSVEGHSIAELRQMAIDFATNDVQKASALKMPAAAQSIDDVAAALSALNGIPFDWARQLMPTRIKIKFDKNSAVLNCLVTRKLNLQSFYQGKVSNLQASDLLLQLMSKYGKLAPGSSKIDPF